MLKKYVILLLWSIAGGLAGLFIYPAYNGLIAKADEMVLTLMAILFFAPFVAGLFLNFREGKNAIRVDGYAMVAVGLIGLALSWRFDLTSYFLDLGVPVGLVFLPGLLAFPVAGIALAAFVTDALLWLRSRVSSVSLPSRGGN